MKLFDVTSPCQRVVLRRMPSQGLMLELDGRRQFSEATEHHYHEALAVLPLRYVAPRRVFIGGGGDGLAVARLLRDPAVEEVVLCDYDRVVTDLARDHPALRRLNGDSLRDPRVQVVNADARAWLEERPDARFDLILCDFPDPWFPELAAIYSREFYALVRDRLAPEGVVVVQTLCYPEVARAIVQTVASVLPGARYYMAGERHGFTLAGRGPLRPHRPLPAWTRAFDDAAADAVFALGKEIAATIEAPLPRVSTLCDPVAVRATLREACRFEDWTDFPYDPSVALVWALADDSSRTDDQVELLVTSLREDARRPVVLYLDVARAALAERLRAAGLRDVHRLEHVRYAFDDETERRALEAWQALDDGRVGRLRARTVSPQDDPLVLSLLQGYLAGRADMFQDGRAGQAVLEQVGRYLTVEGRDGRPMALFKLTGSSRDALATELEVAYGVGSPRDHLLALLAALTLLRRELHDEAIDAFVPDRATAKLARRLGARSLGEVLVLSGDPPT